MLYTYINRHAATPNKYKTKTFVVHNNVFSNSTIDLYTIKVYSLEHKQCYNIVIGKEKYSYILQQVRRDILLHV